MLMRSNRMHRQQPFPRVGSLLSPIGEASDRKIALLWREVLCCAAAQTGFATPKDRSAQCFGPGQWTAADHLSPFLTIFYLGRLILDTEPEAGS